MPVTDSLLNCYTYAAVQETKAGFYVIASPPEPDSGRCELLVKKTDSNVWLCEAEAGTSWPTSPAMGKGFPVDSLADDVNTVLLFAAGTGISPIKAVIESGKLDGKKVSKANKVEWLEESAN